MKTCMIHPTAETYRKQPKTHMECKPASLSAPIYIATVALNPALTLPAHRSLIQESALTWESKARPQPARQLTIIIRNLN